MQTCSFEQFVARLYDSGLIPAREIQSFFDGLPEHHAESTAEDLAAEMVRRGMLTPFQAEALLQGKSRALTLGSYAILDRLGQGGMGQVYRGFHKKMKRVVALKVLPPGPAGCRESLERFRREVEATARLSHPNIVTAFDAGEDKGVRFLVMEYVEGDDLASLVAQRGPLPAVQAVEYVLQAAQGLEYAHWHGIVHRDVKPANLILDWRGIIKLVDLGLVGLVPGVASLGADGDVVDGHADADVLGTPDYVSPDQIADPARPGPACDTYSLGCSLYFLLVGRPVFSGETAEAKLRAHQEQPAPSLRAAGHDIPESLDNLIQRMLAKRPEDRPATMSDVIRELESCLKSLHPARSPGMEVQTGTLVLEVGEPGLVVQVIHDDGKVVVDCPAAEGTATFALHPGRYRLVVSRQHQEWLAKEFEIRGLHREILQVPGQASDQGGRRLHSRAN